MKNTKNDVKMPKSRYNIKSNDINIAIKIKEYIDKERFARERDILEIFYEKYRVSKVTLKRKLVDLVEEHEIVPIEYEALEKYGIQETDKRALYYASKETIEMNNHINAVFNLLDTSKDKKNDVNNAITGIRELRGYETEYYGRYFLDRNQVNKLVELLDKTISNKGFDDDKLKYDLLAIICNEITRHYIIPSNRNFVENLKKLLKKYRSEEYYNKAANPIPFLLQMLGIYMDPIVITRLEEDAEKRNPEVLRTLENQYNSWGTSKIINDNKIKLMQFEVDLQKKGKAEAIEFVERVRKSAALCIRDMQGSKFYNLFEQVRKGDKLEKVET